MRRRDRQAWVPAVIRDVGEDDGEVYVIGLRETAAPDSWSLVFMECYDAEDPQEIGLGMDTYCLVVDPGYATHYGGVRECELDGERLRLTLTEQAAQTLGMPLDTSLALDITPQQVDQLRRGLVRVLTSGRRDAVPERLHV
jgi:Immunity protein 10